MISPDSPTLTSLLERLRPVVAKRSAAALGLWGEAGVGKSTTAARLLQALPCRSVSLHAAAPLSQLAALLGEPARLPRWAARNLARLREGEAHEAVPTLAATLASLAPFALYLEDSHEASPERLALVAALARSAVRSKGVALLVSSRPRPDAAFEEVRVLPLARAASDALLQREVGAELPAEALRWIYERAQGNPLFSLEFFRLLSRQGLLWNAASRWHWRQPEGELMPLTVEALLEMQLADLDQGSALLAVLGGKALLGGAASEALWAEVSGLDAQALSAAKLELRRRGLLAGEDFVHPLYREVALRALPKEARRCLARRALGAVEDAEQAAAFVEAADLDGAERTRRYRLAAQQAGALGHKAAAARFLKRAADAAPEEARAELALEAARALEGVDYETMAALAERAAALLDDPTEAIYLLATAQAVLGRNAEMQRTLARLPEATRRSEAWADKYIMLLYNVTRFRELLEFWEARPDLHASCDSFTAYRVASAWLALGQSAKAAELTARMLTRAQDPRAEADLLDMQAALAFYRGDYQQAEAFFDAGLGLGALAPQQRANLLRNRSVTRLQQGAYGGALADFEEALGIYAEVGNSLHYAQTLVMTSYVHLENGAFERAEEVLHEALALFRAIEPQPFYVLALAQLVELYAQWPASSHPFLARKHAEEAWQAAQAVGDAESAVVAALARARTAPRAAAQQRAEEALKRALAFGHPEASVQAYMVLGLAHKMQGHPEAQAAFAEAESLARRHGLVLEAHKAGLELDALKGDLASARRRLEWFGERGLAGAAAVAKRTFPELEAPEAPRDPELWLLALGPLRALRGDEPLTLRGHKRRELLAALLEARLAGRSERASHELARLLYPGEPDDLAAASLKQLVFQLRRSLGAGTILRTAGGYALGAARSDAEAFLESGDCRLWRGAWLEDVALARDETVAAALYHALAQRAEACAADDPREAARLGRLLMEAEPYDRRALALTLRALRAEGSHRGLAALYKEGRARLAEVGERLPARWEEFLTAS